MCAVGTIGKEDVLDHKTVSTVAEAQAWIATYLVPPNSREIVPLATARNRILSRPVTAPFCLPRHDVSAVDGYAVSYKDIHKWAAKRLRIVGRVSAGHPFQPAASPDSAIEVLTGAVVPTGYDTVVMQEDCELDGGFVTLKRDLKRGTNLRLRGEELAEGDIVLPSSRRVEAYDIGLLAILGKREIEVFRRLRIALLSTGDELREPGSRLQLGQIFDANRWVLCEMLSSQAFDVTDLGIVPDDADTLERVLFGAAQNHDLLITTGGISVGRRDHLRAVIQRRGSLDIWRLAVKPGKPVGIGDIDDCPILALPGNPVAALTMFLVVGRMVVQRLAGAVPAMPVMISLPLDKDLHKKPGRLELHLARLTNHGRQSLVTRLEKQGPAMMSAVSAADGFIVLPADLEQVRAGQPVSFASMASLVA